jgi:hypothetical protein
MFAAFRRCRLGPFEAERGVGTDNALDCVRCRAGQGDVDTGTRVSHGGSLGEADKDTRRSVLSPKTSGSETLAHALLDFQESFRAYIENEFSRLEAATSTEAAADVLLDLGETIRHVLYHLNNSSFFRYLDEQVISSNESMVPCDVTRLPGRGEAYRRPSIFPSPNRISGLLPVARRRQTHAVLLVGAPTARDSSWRRGRR